MKEKISRTKIERRIGKKTNQELIRTLIKIKKTNPRIAKILAGPIKKSLRVNLEKIENLTTDVKNILIPGKILSSGNLTKKIKIVALSFSEKAREKIKRSGSEAVLISEEIKKNPQLNNLDIII